VRGLACTCEAADGGDGGAWGVGAATDEFPFGEPLSVRKARAEVIARPPVCSNRCCARISPATCPYAGACVARDCDAMSAVSRDLMHSMGDVLPTAEDEAWFEGDLLTSQPCLSVRVHSACGSVSYTTRPW
jgi:hypothetical protein